MHRAGFNSYAQLHSSMAGVDPATGRKYDLRGDDLLQCYEIYAVLKAEQDVGMFHRGCVCTRRVHVGVDTRWGDSVTRSVSCYLRSVWEATLKYD